MKDKIRKLLAMAQDPGASQTERDTASRQVAFLMTKHDIELGDLAEDELRSQFDMIRGEAPGCRPGKKNPTEVPAWIGVIAWGVKCYTRTRVTHGHGMVYFHGPREDVELAQWLHTLIIQDCYKASKGRSISEATAFRGGYASVIQSRLKSMAADRDKSDVQGYCNALVRVDTIRQEEMNSHFGPEAKGRSSHIRQGMEGRIAGQQASIPSGRPVSQSLLRITQ